MVLFDRSVEGGYSPPDPEIPNPTPKPVILNTIELAEMAYLLKSLAGNPSDPGEGIADPIQADLLRAQSIADFAPLFDQPSFSLLLSISPELTNPQENAGKQLASMAQATIKSLTAPPHMSGHGSS